MIAGEADCSAGGETSKFAVERSMLGFVGSWWIVLCTMLKKGKRVSVRIFLSRRGCLIQESNYSESGDKELMKCVENGSNLKFNGDQDMTLGVKCHIYSVQPE